MKLKHLLTKNFFCNIQICIIIWLVFNFDLVFGNRININYIYGVPVLLSYFLNSKIYCYVYAMVCSMLLIVATIIQQFSVENIGFLLNDIVALCMLWALGLFVGHTKKTYFDIEKISLRHKMLLTISRDPIVILNNNGVICMASQSVYNVFGLFADKIINKKLDFLFSPQETKDINKVLIYSKRSSKPSYFVTLEKTGLHAYGHRFPCEITINYVSIDKCQENYYSVILRDITERKKTEKKLLWLSTHDELTGIYNRRFFNQRICEYWSDAFRYSKGVSILLIDVDYFKEYNDSFGHQAGDICLKKIAKTISGALSRSCDFVARYGGEEFIVILHDTDGEGCVSIAKKIQASVFSLNIVHPSSKISDRITLSLGISTIANTRNTTLHEILKQADIALYQAKSQGRNKFHVHGS